MDITFRSVLVLALFALSSVLRAEAPGDRYIATVPGMSEYRIRKTETDEFGMTHTWADQYDHGRPVIGGEAILHLNRDGTLDTIDEEAILNLRAPTSPRYSATDATSIAQTYSQFQFGSTSGDRPIVELYVVQFADIDYLAYQVKQGTIQGPRDEAQPIVWVDAVNGQVFWAYDNLQRQLAQGPSLYFGNVYFPVVQFNGLKFMQDSDRNMTCLSAKDTINGEFPVFDKDFIFDTSPDHVGANDCWLNMLLTYEYFKQKHNWVGMNNANGPGTTTLLNGSPGFTAICDYGDLDHYQQAFNAKFDSYNNKVYFGGLGGFTSNVGEYVSCNAVGHEMTHAVTQFTANIMYYSQSGVVNESMSDVFGAMVARFRDGVTNDETWLIGEDLHRDDLTPSSADRDMRDPERFGQPDHISEAEFPLFTDSGNVHLNSGIANKAFSLVAVGGDHTNSPGNPMTGIGENKAEKIWFRALRFHMGFLTNFKRARKSTVKAATELFGAGSTEVAKVKLAWSTCGL